tara:strand:+ start:100 stop:456 length:357 start_codon:yes stop_codon:yes gene_type:complete
MVSVEITPYLDINLESSMWVCSSCNGDIIGSSLNYKTGCLISERDPSEVHQSEIDSDYKFSPDSDWCRIVEFYCPHCGAMIENEYLPPGHPITHDIEIDLKQLQDMVLNNPDNLRIKT